jgi:hypothetical protein
MVCLYYRQNSTNAWNSDPLEINAPLAPVNSVGVFRGKYTTVSNCHLELQINGKVYVSVAPRGEKWMQSGNRGRGGGYEEGN